MIITLPAGTTETACATVVSAALGIVGWVFGTVFWMEWTDHSGSVTDIVPILCWVATSALVWVVFTGRITFREAPR